MMADDSGRGAPEGGATPAGASRLAADQIAGKVAWITGGAHGIGAAVARRLAGLGASVLVTDVDPDAGQAVADEIGGVFARCDVSDPAASLAAVQTATDRFGGLDIAFLNAGVSTGFGLDERFDPAAYRRVMGINLDGVVFGVHAALPALSARGGGDIIATASLAGLTAVPFDPIYAANKHAIVGLVRSLGPLYAPEGIRVNALCPSFADTAIVDTIRGYLADAGVPLIDVDTVVDTVESILAGGGAGDCWYVQVGRPSEPFRFRGVPGPRSDTGTAAPAASAERQLEASTPSQKG